MVNIGLLVPTIALREEPNKDPGRGRGAVSGSVDSPESDSSSSSSSSSESDSIVCFALEGFERTSGKPNLALRIAAIAGDHRAWVERSRLFGSTGLRAILGTVARSGFLPLEAKTDRKLSASDLIL